MSELELRDEWFDDAIAAGHGKYTMSGVDITYQGVQQIAHRAVSAKLHELADDPLADEPKIDNWTSGEVAGWLRRCADELDPKGSP